MSLYLLDLFIVKGVVSMMNASICVALYNIEDCFK